MVKHRHLGSAFVFHIVGILTMLRAVPFALYGKDRTLSVAHTASVYALIASQGIEVRPASPYVFTAKLDNTVGNLLAARNAFLAALNNSFASATLATGSPTRRYVSPISPRTSVELASANRTKTVRRSRSTFSQSVFFFCRWATRLRTLMAASIGSACSFIYASVEPLSASDR
jgi:hypothetical protein